MTTRKKPVESELEDSTREKPRARSHSRPVRSDLGRHRRRCVVCAHPNRDAIEYHFLRWRSPEKLALDYDIADHSSIYRHVHATGLYAHRQKTIHAALESILERTDKIHSSDLDVVRAASIYAHMDECGQWVDTPIKLIIKLIEDAECTPDLPRPGVFRSRQARSNSQPGELKNDATR